jgi:hypothetical protein
MASEKAARVSRLFLSTVEFNGKKPVSSIKKGSEALSAWRVSPARSHPTPFAIYGCDLADALRRADLPPGSLDALKVAPATLLDQGGQQPEFPKKKKSKTKPRPK